MTNFEDSTYNQEDKELIDRFEHCSKTGEPCLFEEDEYLFIFEYYIEKDRFDMCEILVDNAEKQYPMSADIMDCRARLFAAGFDFHAALKKAEQALKLDPNNIDILLTKGKVLLHLARKEDADETFALIETLEDDDRENTYLEIGYAYCSICDFVRAKQYLARTLRINKDNEDALHEMAQIEDTEGNTQRAIQLHEQVLDNNPYSARSWAELGAIYFDKEIYDKAAEAYDYAYTINPNDCVSLLQKANSLFGCGQFEEAISIYEEYCDQKGENAECLIGIGECYENLSEIEKAKEAYTKATELDPENVMAMVSLCVINLDSANYKDALHYIDEVLKRDGTKSEYHILKAETFIGLKKQEKARACYQRAIEIDPSQTHPLVALGNLAFDRKDYKESLEFLEKAYKINKDTEELKLFLALTHYKLGDVQKAVYFLKKACKEKQESLSVFMEFCPEAIMTPEVMALSKRYEL